MRLWNPRETVSSEERLQWSGGCLWEGSAATLRPSLRSRCWRLSEALLSLSNNDQPGWSQGRLGHRTAVLILRFYTIQHKQHTYHLCNLYWKQSDSKANRTQSSLREASRSFQSTSSHLHRERRPEVTSHPHTRQGCPWRVVGHSGTRAVCFFRIELCWASLLLGVVICAVRDILHWSERPWKWVLKVKAWSLTAR